MSNTTDMVLVPEAPKLGIIYGEPIDAYHATDATSHSKLEVLRDSDRGPARYFAKFIERTLVDEGRKAHFDIGNALDALLLEGPRAFKRRVAIKPADAPREPTAAQIMAVNRSDKTEEAIKFWAKFFKKASGKIVLDAEQHAQVWELYDAACANTDLLALVKGARAGVTFRSALKHFNVQARPDKWTINGIVLPSTGKKTGAYILDLKTAEDLPRFLKFLPGYARQAALYIAVTRMVLADLRGCQIEDIEEIQHFFGVVFKTAPIDAVVYQLHPDDLAAADSEIREDLKKLRRCYETDKWPGSPSGINQLPRVWRKKTNNQEEIS